LQALVYIKNDYSLILPPDRYKAGVCLLLLIFYTACYTEKQGGASSSMVPTIVLIIVIVAAAALIVAAFFLGIGYRKKVAEGLNATAEEEAKRIVSEAVKAADAKKKEVLVEAREEIHKLRSEAERESRERRQENTRQERRLIQKEEALDRKTDQLEQKDEALSKKQKEADDKLEEIDAIKKRQFEMLERISGFTVEQAKSYLLQNLENELSYEKSVKIKEYEQELKEESDKKAREVISLAIQRCAADHVAEATVSVVPLPNDEMKGRIIGREGRNIRTLETLTGVDLIIDDTPEAITLSCFDPVRREIARISLERLISDGRIHPARIEEMVEKAKKEVDNTIRQEGEQAVIEAGVHGMHHELVKLLGRLRYRTSYGQNVLNHSLEVSSLAGTMASELGVDPMLARRAGLLHDIGKAVDHEVEGSHVQIGVDIAKKFKENGDVIHAIEAHHGDVEPHTVIACIVQAADAISAARPGARRENLENYIRRLEKLEEIANSFDGVEKSYAIQAGREIRIMVKPEVVDDNKIVLIAREIVSKIENELDYPGQIKVHVIRESRAIEYAK
jgi:ribonuclease Y